MGTVKMIHQQLDAHLAALEAAGDNRRRIPVDRPSEATVRQLLRGHGYFDRDDVVGVLTWQQHQQPGPDPRFHLFWEAGQLAQASEAIAIHDTNRSQVLSWGSNIRGDDEWPGPAHWLPVVLGVGSAFLAVDCRPDPEGGAVFYCFVECPNTRLFSSLAEAIETATYSVQAGLWTVREGLVHCERSIGPSAGDLTSPPWASYHEPPTTRLVGPSAPIYRKQKSHPERWL